jgi:hypothetical protein
MGLCGARLRFVLDGVVLAGGGIGGDFFDHVIGAEAEVGTADVFYRDVKGAEDEFGAAEIDGIAGEGVDDFHERGLKGFSVFDESDGMKAGLRRSPTALVPWDPPHVRRPLYMLELWKAKGTFVV